MLEMPKNIEKPIQREISGYLIHVWGHVDKDGHRHVEHRITRQSDGRVCDSKKTQTDTSLMRYFVSLESSFYYNLVRGKYEIQ